MPDLGSQLRNAAFRGDSFTRKAVFGPLRCWTSLVGRIESAKRLLASGISPKNVARNLGVSIPTLYRWVPASRTRSVLCDPSSETPPILNCFTYLGMPQSARAGHIAPAA
ncbi:MAG: helix-turn-helix domain-containing protein [Proteobacteria bacterium]|nr:helix-turn-helix domain-containing protein [Pseudomonadota bacterium]